MWAGMPQKDGGGGGTYGHTSQQASRDPRASPWVPTLLLPLHSGLDPGGTMGLCLSHSETFS